MKNMIAYCGLDCETCDAYLATIHDDQALREKTAKLWAALNHAPILPEHINCQGCRVAGTKTVFCDRLCDIRKCALKRGVATCGACPDMEKCQTIGVLVSNNPEALENLKGEATMNELIKQLLDDETTETFHSREAFESRAKALGFGAEDIAAALEEIGEIPLSDEDLQDAVGGINKKFGFAYQKKTHMELFGNRL